MRVPTTARNVAGALAFGARVALAEPRAFADALRHTGARILDARFEQTSPLPPLPDEVARAAYDADVALPPLNVLELGNQSVDGLLFLVGIARALEAAEVFEIGTYNGVTAWCLARNLPGATVHTLDLPAGDSPALEVFEGDELHMGTPRRFYEDAPGTPGAIRQLLGDSAAFDFSPYAGRCQLVYVDGAHSFEYVSSDSRRAFETVAPGGAIVWDDYSRNMRGVVEALHALGEREPLWRVPGTRLVIHLRPEALRRLAP